MWYALRTVVTWVPARLYSLPSCTMFGEIILVSKETSENWTYKCLDGVVPVTIQSRGAGISAHLDLSVVTPGHAVDGSCDGQQSFKCYARMSTLKQYNKEIRERGVQWGAADILILSFFTEPSKNILPRTRFFFSDDTLCHWLYLSVFPVSLVPMEIFWSRKSHICNWLRREG